MQSKIRGEVNFTKQLLLSSVDLSKKKVLKDSKANKNRNCTMTMKVAIH